MPNHVGLLPDLLLEREALSARGGARNLAKIDVAAETSHQDEALFEGAHGRIFEARPRGEVLVDRREQGRDGRHLERLRGVAPSVGLMMSITLNKSHSMRCVDIEAETCANIAVGRLTVQGGDLLTHRATVLTAQSTLGPAAGFDRTRSDRG